MNIAFAITLTVLLHVSFLVAYPASGSMGVPFIMISTLLWSSLIVFTHAVLRNFSRGNLVFFCIFFFSIMALSTATLLPQKDAVSIFDKLVAGRYPTRETLYLGLRKVGIDYPALLKGGVKNQYEDTAPLPDNTDAGTKALEQTKDEDKL